MCKLTICFCDRDFEHDIYELTRAFYPGREIVSVYSEEMISGFPVITVWKDGLHYRITYKDEADTREADVQLTGQPYEDALLSCSDRHAVRKENKDRIKIRLYDLLREQTGTDLPWGALTGIRPVKLATAMLEQGMSNPETARTMRERYRVSTSRAALAVAIANQERAVLASMDAASGYSLYVGIPFCPSICLYCSFSSSPVGNWRKRVDEYVDLLNEEIRQTADMMKATGRHLDTLYIGGGTPTTLSPGQLDRLLLCLQSSFDLETLREFTVEAGRPDSIDSGKLTVLRRYPVTRISVNPQTMNDETLRLIGRHHTADQTREAFAMAREAGFDNINMDIIIGLPGEDRQMVERTLQEIRKLDPDSLTVHTLALKRAARLNLFRKDYEEISFENSLEIMDLTLQAAREMGMSPYYLYRQKNMKGNFENVGYAKVDKACIYNILIMEEKQPIVAAGAGGASKLLCPDGQRIERVENVKDVLHYLTRSEEMIARKAEAIARIYGERKVTGVCLK